MAKDSSKNVLKKVAGNWDTPPDVLRKLHEMNDHDIDNTLAVNPKTPIDIVRKFAESSDFMLSHGAKTYNLSRRDASGNMIE